MKNKVTFGLCNVHIAKLIKNNGAITYDTPFALPGGIKLSMSKEGALSLLRADNTDYYKKASNNGYKGSLEVADVIEKFLTDILGQYKDANGGIFENAGDIVQSFAMMCEIDGDEVKRRVVFYECLAERPQIEYETTEEGEIKPKTATMDITISPRSTDGEVKCVLEKSTENEAVFNNFFSSVYERAEGSGV